MVYREKRDRDRERHVHTYTHTHKHMKIKIENRHEIKPIKDTWTDFEVVRKNDDIQIRREFG